MASFPAQHAHKANHRAGVDRVRARIVTLVPMPDMLGNLLVMSVKMVLTQAVIKGNQDATVVKLVTLVRSLDRARVNTQFARSVHEEDSKNMRLKTLLQVASYLPSPCHSPGTANTVRWDTNKKSLVKQNVKIVKVALSAKRAISSVT